MKAIVTKYHPNYKRTHSAYMSATAEGAGNKVVLSHSVNVSSLENHRAACVALCTKNKWDGKWVSGLLPNGDMVWVEVQEKQEYVTVEVD